MPDDCSVSDSPLLCVGYDMLPKIAPYVDSTREVMADQYPNGGCGQRIIFMEEDLYMHCRPFKEVQLALREDPPSDAVSCGSYGGWVSV